MFEKLHYLIPDTDGRMPTEQQPLLKSTKWSCLPSYLGKGTREWGREEGERHEVHDLLCWLMDAQYKVTRGSSSRTPCDTATSPARQSFITSLLILHWFGSNTVCLSADRGGWHMVKRFAIGLYRKQHQMGLNFCPLRSRMCTFILLSGGGRDGMEFGCRAGLIAYDQFGGSRSREPCLLNQIALIICDNGVFLHGKK